MVRRRIPLKVNPPPSEDEKTALILLLGEGFNKALARIEELESPRSFILERAGNVHRDMKAGLRAQQAVCAADDTAHMEHAKFMFGLQVCSWATGETAGDLIDKWLNKRSAGDDLDEWLGTNDLSDHRVDAEGS